MEPIQDHELEEFYSQFGFLPIKEVAIQRFNKAITHLFSHYPGHSNYHRHFRAVATQRIIAEMPPKELDAAKEFFDHKRVTAAEIEEFEYNSIVAQYGKKGEKDIQDAFLFFKHKYAALEALEYANRMVKVKN